MAAETGVPDAAELYDRAACGLLVTAADGTILVVNDTFCRWIGIARDDLVGRRKLQELLTVGARIFHQTHWAPLLQMQGSVAEVKLDLIHAGGEVKPMILNAVSRTSDGVVRHEIAAFGAEDRHRYERELLQARRRAEELHTRSMETQRALVDTQAELDVQRRNAEDRALFAEQMIGIVSHDLRNPLGTIKMAVTAVLRRAEDPRIGATLTRALNATDRATRLIRDLLDFTRARLGSGIPVTFDAMDMHTVASDVVDEMRVAEPDREIGCAADGDGSMSGDADRLAQVLTNLLTNALRYSPKGSAVDVRTRGFADHVAIEVHNVGEPIPPDRLDRVFEPLERGTREGAGIGLGLFIVREIIRAHGGTISVDSSLDRGTTFAVRLPRNGAETAQRRSNDGMKEPAPTNRRCEE
jgi:phosphoserine phosphatase RsbU/P